MTLDMEAVMNRFLVMVAAVAYQAVFKHHNVLNIWFWMKITGIKHIW